MIYVRYANAEMYTALSDMEELLETEAVLITNLESYVDAYEEKINFLRRYAYRFIFIFLFTY